MRVGTKDYGSMFPMLLLILLLLLGTLAGLGWKRKKREEMRATVQADLRALKVALTVYQVDSEGYPSTAQGLDVLLRRPTLPPAPNNWLGPYWETNTLPSDPWGNPYVYRCPGLHFTYDVFSAGPDGQAGTEDDIPYR